MTIVSRSKWAAGATMTSGLAMALVPKCPACVAAYFGFFSAFGVDLWAPDYLWPLTYTLFGASLIFLAFRAWRDAFYKPFALVVAGACALIAARVQDASPVFVWTGCGLFLAGVLWSARHAVRPNIAPCHVREPAQRAVS